MRTTFSLIVLLLCTQAKAQNFLSWKYNDRYFTASIGTGTSSYFGELNFENTLNDNLSLISAGAEVRLLTHVGARIDAAYFTLEGADSNAPDSSFQKQRNLSFNSNNFQIQLTGSYYFKTYRGDYFKRWAFDPYAFTGIGYVYYSPRASLGGESIPLRPLKTEGETYRKWTFAIPIGIGGKFRVNNFTNLVFEVSYHYTFTDYLDDVSNNYGTAFESTTGELLSNRKDEIPLVNQEAYDQQIPGAPRGDNASNDSFLMIRVKGEFYLPPNFFSKKKK